MVYKMNKETDLKTLAENTNAWPFVEARNLRKRLVNSVDFRRQWEWKSYSICAPACWGRWIDSRTHFRSLLRINSRSWFCSHCPPYWESDIFRLANKVVIRLVQRSSLRIDDPAVSTMLKSSGPMVRALICGIKSYRFKSYYLSFNYLKK